MSCSEFLNRIDEFVGYVVEFTAVWKATGEKAGKFHRYVWDNKEFGSSTKNALMETVNVDIIRKAERKRTNAGICYI